METERVNFQEGRGDNHHVNRDFHFNQGIKCLSSGVGHETKVDLY